VIKGEVHQLFIKNSQKNPQNIKIKKYHQPENQKDNQVPNFIR